jgi:hypothetical protein
MYRRVCLLRCCGRTAEAARLESDDLANALRRIAAPAGETDAFVTYRDGIFELERERVRQAQAVAELLAPLLLEHLGRAPDPARSARPVPAKPIVRGPVNIADMIDTMLNQQTELAGR